MQDDGFSLDLSQVVIRPPMRYKPDFVSPLAARFAPHVEKPDFRSPIEPGTRYAQGQTASAVAGLGAAHSMQRPRTVAYKRDWISPIAARSAPYSNKPDFVSPLDPGGARSTRYLQTRTSAGLARLFDQFDPNVSVTSDPGRRAIDVARQQIGLDPLARRRAPTTNDDGAVVPAEEAADDSGTEITDETYTDDSGLRDCVETAFRKADCSMKTLPVVGGVVGAAALLWLLTRGG